MAEAAEFDVRGTERWRTTLISMPGAHSDLAYDVAAVWCGRFFRLDDHLDRLFRECERLRMTSPATWEEIRAIMIETVRRSALQDAYVRRRYAYAIPFPPGAVDPTVKNLHGGTSCAVSMRRRTGKPGWRS
jgi:branched-subunit amino acid aminotransferase/4-amino-4-deoxychorismate lyase